MSKIVWSPETGWTDDGPEVRVGVDERGRLTSDVIERRRELCQTRTATLDGHPAVISGAREPFATVSTLTGITQAQWAWPTVARIVANGGAFRS